MQIKTRWQAFGVHLGISLVIFVFAMIVLVKYWYPSAFIQLGGWQGIRIVAGVDIILGPLLTLIVFDKNKKSLKFDLSAIAAFQIACLAGGLLIVHNERPTAQVIFEGKLYILSKNDFAFYNLDIATLSRIKGPYPKLVYIDLPDDKEEIEQLKAISSVLGGEPLYMRLDLYQNPNQARMKILTNSLTENSFNPEKKCYEMQYESQHGVGLGCVSLKTGLVDIVD